MGRIKSAIELLDGWSEGEKPTTDDARHMIGAWASKAMLGFIVFEWVVQLAWQSYGSSHYNYFSNYVSDLGATTCGYQNLDKPGERWVCSPSFVAIDLALVFIGISVVVAACLITSPVLWIAAHPGDLYSEYQGWRRKPPDKDAETNAKTNAKAPVGPGMFARVMTITVRVVMAVTGLAIATIGAIPEDFNPLLHDTAVRVLLVGICVTLVSIGILWFKRTNWALFFIFLTVVSAASGITMGATNGASGLSGLWERGVIYSFIVGLATIGFMVTVGARQERRGKSDKRRQNPWVVRKLGIRPIAPRATVLPDGLRPGPKQFRSLMDVADEFYI
ncbi:hypothetical protein [Arthrobacter sp. KNU40]|uniref:hypothetical protein n=1 Tax=Arthrobacter sp. KNU40 TaxID=3447965 RepID=UPI003F5F3B66